MKPLNQMRGRGKSLSGRMLQASGWSFVQIFSTYALRLASNLIMTRLLMPEAFGLMALVGFFISGLELLSDIGIHRSVMREPDGDQTRFLRAAWSVKVTRGIVLAIGMLVFAGLAWLLAPVLAPAGTIYGDPRLPGLIAVSALIPLLVGSEATTKELTARRLQNWRFTVVGIVAQTTGLLVMILLSQWYASVWILVFGMIANSFVGMVASHLFYLGPWMRFEWDSEVSARLWHYGKFLMASSAFTFIARSADKMILAGLLTPSNFGLLSIAVIWTTAGSALVTRVAERVGFPAISEVIRTRPDALRRLFRRFQTAIDLLCVSAFLVTFLLGGLLIQALYTPEYAEAGRYLSILSLSFLVLRFHTENQLLMNVGNSRAMMVISAMQAVAICILVPLSYRYIGLDGMLIVIALAPAVTAPYTIAKLKPILGSRQAWLDMCIWAVILLTGCLVYLVTKI